MIVHLPTRCAETEGTDGTDAGALAVLSSNPVLITSEIEWVRAGYAPTNVAYANATYPGDQLNTDANGNPLNGTVSPMAYTGADVLTVTGVTANNKVYDGTATATLDTASAALSGVAPGDDVTLVTSGAVASFGSSNVETNDPVTVSGMTLSGTDAYKYTLIQPTGLAANITPAPLTVTANTQTMTYGGTVPNLTVTVSGLVGNDTPSSVLSGSLATTATTSSPVGSYPISVGTLVADANYNMSFAGATLSITPAPLTITANNESMAYGQPLPTLTVSYIGFVNGDTFASLTTLPTVTTSATSNSPPGTYVINVSARPQTTIPSRL